ncbi:MAG TPA: bifunctional (p)ppGpp synthetase/guanosine-3',5'-bis(diphosphate) 3'-pyrophosphohydrolase [Clostridiaceae bacterium]
MLEDFIKRIEKVSSNIDRDLIIKAYNFAEKAHENQKRESGDPYIIHPVEVACILAEMGLDSNTIVAGLLHDVIEDTHFTYEDVTRTFNGEVANLVDGVTKLDEIEDKTREEEQADNVRKMLLAMAKDARVILIKLADRLHNMRTLKYMPVEKQREKSKETFDIYAPLAHRLGMSKLKWELEDLAFRYTNPEEYYDLVKSIAEKRVEREASIDEIIEELQTNLQKSAIDADIDGRPKHFYSIYRKMVSKSKSVDQIFDLTAVRILVKSVKDCYAALGIVHTLYKPIPGRFKDYIAMPKPNMYQSLHSTVISSKGKPFEIQIRTFEMHKTAEYGIAAHWKYKEKVSGEGTENKFDLKLSWLHEILDWQNQTSDAEEFMEGFKIDLFSDEIFVFTPKGTVINLPNESTPIDFAYKIHTDIGNMCIGAKVNGKMQPLDYKLKTGEIVDILTSSSPKGPSIDWMNMAKSNQARSKIKAWFKRAKRDENIDKGKELLEKETKKQGYNFGEFTKMEPFTAYMKKYNFNIIDDLFAAVGVGDIIASSLVSKLKDLYIRTNKQEVVTLKDIEEQINKKTNKNIKEKALGAGIIVKGASNLLVRYAKCCNPVPGDYIMGYITQGRGVSIHRKDCKNIDNLLTDSANKIIEVSWGDSDSGDYLAQIQIKAEDRDGLLTEIMEIISETKIHLNAINGKTSKSGIAQISLKAKISNIEQLRDLMKKIKKLEGVNEVFRTKN